MQFKCLRDINIHAPRGDKSKKKLNQRPDADKRFRKHKVYDLVHDPYIAKEVMDIVLERGDCFLAVDDAAKTARASRMAFLEAKKVEEAQLAAEAEREAVIAKAEKEAEELLLKEQAEKRVRERLTKAKAKVDSPAPKAKAPSESERPKKKTVKKKQDAEDDDAFGL